MSSTEESIKRLRRQPPAFRRMALDGVVGVTPRMLRLTFSGPELDGLVIDEPAASVRLLIPSPGTDELVIPEWNGNEFLLPDGGRPVIRTFTPLRSDGSVHDLDVAVVVHPGGLVAEWASRATPGDVAAVSGPGRGYELDPDARAYLLAGDESAIPAIGQLLERIPPDIPVRVLIEVVSAEAILELPHHPSADIDWITANPATESGDGLIGAIGSRPLEPGIRVWAAGEAAVMQRIRRRLFDEGGIERSNATVRGYWKRRSITPAR